ncbi:MAG TPA: BMP family ABC transporter substrate-binding protein, partial [Anaerolineales bacterium]|nr:BMP family ABC transporter substrate-binding protein [Anaerolineales bacterium]
MRTYFPRLAMIAMALMLVLAACGGEQPAVPQEQSDAGQPASTAQEDKLKACFIYVGPIGDIGWTNAHDVGRRYVDDKYDWLETAYAESVPEADSERFIDRFVVEENCDVVFTTSFGFMDPTFSAAQKYPDNYFFHVSGFKRAPNM